ncbi:unnamed protein product [Acanthoscelides obtectus]|uniref:Uncharacterized protein n=1 Tax=Acanthoscelides obtectus TaxID=200917 RepID=A0A9P0L230_ACAOB|nr:unnamed protein product [Acanthoscelides obtectus]CAK1630407.1 hypothetical protein AOBTE_LOCUS6306 [Acanthoscelides obtectus]
MGITNSKVGKQLDKEVLHEASIPSTPIITPLAIRKNDWDPRSPSANIARTPLEVLSAAADKLEELYEENATPLKSTAYILADDPRSPTTEFKRTPIIVNDKEDLLKKVHTKNLEKRLQGDVDSVNPTINHITKRNIVPPKLLESSPIRPKPDSCKRKSFVGLLETNIDYTETDIDVAFQEKCKVALDTPKKIAIVETKDIDPRSPTTDFLRTPIQNVRKIGEIQLDAEDNQSDVEMIRNILDEIVDKVVNECVIAPDEVEPDVEQQLSTNVDVLVGDSPKILAKEAIEPKPAETEFEQSIPMLDDANETLILGGPLNVTPEIDQRELKSAPVTPPAAKNIMEETSSVKQTKSAPMSPCVNIQEDLIEFDKKLTDLIYEDADVSVYRRVATLKEYNIRSPLQNLNGDAGKKKLVPKLKVSDRPRKSNSNNDAVSKIPVFKEKGKKHVQCENTPPRNIEKKKVKPKPQACLWDKDTTLYL